MDKLIKHNAGGTPRLLSIGVPIGDSRDYVKEITPRMRAAFEECDLLLCEDTRMTEELIQHANLSVKCSLRRLDQHVEKDQLGEFIQEIDRDRLNRSSLTVGLVTDAGTPALQDPGGMLVREFLRQGWKVSPVAGPSSLTAFISISGFYPGPLEFLGYLPRKSSQLKALWQETIHPTRTVKTARIFFESPERIEGSFQLFYESMLESRESRSDAWMTIAKELTKPYERIWAGYVSDVIPEILKNWREDASLKKGEWVFGIQPARDADEIGSPAMDSRIKEFVRIFYIKHRGAVKPTELAKALSQAFGVSRDEIYKYLLSI